MRRGLSIFTVILVGLGVVASYKDGAPDKACESMKPGHKLPQQNVPMPFTITVSQNTYDSGDTIKVMINATTPRKFKGFLIAAKRADPRLNNQEAIGYFTKTTGTKFVCSSNYGIGLTHSDGPGGSGDLKSSLELTWTAPTPTQNHIYFWVTVVADFDTYWIKETSELVSDVNAAPLPPTSAAPPASIKLMSSPIDLTDCGKSKGCYRNPAGCSELYCDMLVTWTDRGSYMDFELSADSEGWVAVGFSDDTKMGGDDVYECVWNPTKSIVEAKHSYNSKEGKMNIDSEGGLIRDVEGEKTDGRIRCRFRRDKTLNSYVYSADYADFVNEYHILLAKGMVDDYGQKERHLLEPSKYPYVSKQKVQLTNDVDIDGTARYFLVKIHGCLMLIAWMLCAPVALILAKYYKPMWPNDRLCKEKVWFAVHRGCMIVTLICTVIAFILIFIHAWGYSQMPELPDKAHPILGIIVTICAVINPLLAICRCKPKSAYRPIFNWIHWFFGTIGSVLAVPALFIGLNLHKAFVPWWATWVLVAFMLFHLIVELMLEIHGCVNSRKQKYRNEEYELSKKGLDGRGEYYRLEPEPVGTNFKKRILAVYLVVAIILFIVLLITVAVS